MSEKMTVEQAIEIAQATHWAGDPRVIASKNHNAAIVLAKEVARLTKRHEMMYEALRDIANSIPGSGEDDVASKFGHAHCIGRARTVIEHTQNEEAV